MQAVNPVLLLAAHDLCDGEPLDSEYVRGIAEVIIETSIGINHDEHKDMIIRVITGTVQTDPNGPLTAEQRAALFAGFSDVFGTAGNEQRYAFTRMVLGKSAHESVSWSTHKPGRLTYGEASKVLDALNLLNV
jgi:hypothetical protein